MPTPLGGGVAIWLTTVSILAMGLLAVRVLGPASFPSRWRAMRRGSYERSGELVWILGAGQCDHGHGTL